MSSIIQLFSPDSTGGKPPHESVTHCQLPKEVLNTDPLLLMWSTYRRVWTLHMQRLFVSWRSHPWRRVGWNGKGTGMHCGCNSVESCLRLLALLFCSVEIAVPAWTCADRYNWHPGSLCRSEKLWSLPWFWTLMFEVFGRRTWPKMNLSALEVNVFYNKLNVAVVWCNHTGDRDWFGLGKSQGEKDCLVFSWDSRVQGSQHRKLLEGNETCHFLRYLKTESAYSHILLNCAWSALVWETRNNELNIKPACRELQFVHFRKEKPCTFSKVSPFGNPDVPLPLSHSVSKSR